MKTLLLLEDNDDRIAAFEAAVHELGEAWQIRVWLDAPTMLAECADCLAEAHLISLDHDSSKASPSVTRWVRCSLIRMPTRAE